MITVSAIPALRDNYVWLIHGRDEPTRVAAVDPGESAPVERALAGLDLTLACILVTHHHWDHTDGIDALVARHGCEVWGPAGEDIPHRSHALREGDTAAVLGHEFAVLDIPGHTAGHIAYTGHGALFCGDTLFAAGCGKLFEGTPAEMHASLTKLASLPADTSLYCGHEYTVANLAFARTVEPDNAAIAGRARRAGAQRDRGEPTLPCPLADEFATNPFLRCDTDPVRRSAERHAGRPLHTPVEVFATVRAWKNAF